MVGRIGVCSWSLEPASAGDLVEKLRGVGADSVQLGLDPLRTSWDLKEVVSALAKGGMEVVSGMMTMAGEDYSTPATIRETGGLVPDATWDTNRVSAVQNAMIARRLGVKLVTFHAGFVPEDRADPSYARLLERIRAVADIFSAAGARVGLETGQESAAGLHQLLVDLHHRAVGVNFDPANMLLYGSGDPGAALETVSEYVVQAHVKDAVAPNAAGEWGTEVVAGSGSVDWQRFFSGLQALPQTVDLFVEREAGTDRLADLRQGLELAHMHREQAQRST